MLKRLSVVTAVFFLLAAFLTPAFAGTYDANAAINDALENCSSYYQDRHNFNGDTIRYVTSTGLSNITDGNGNSYGFLTYGQHHGNYRNGQHRYIGYTYYGEDYTNMDFPADKNANGANFASPNWVIQPWKDPAVRASNKNLSGFNGDGSPQYRTAILAGIMAYGGTNANNGYLIGETEDASFYGKIEQYVHILAPPTKYAWGIGRMWHIKNGQLWYVTIPIAPEALLPAAPDLSTNLETDSFTGAKPGEKITSTVAYRLNPDHPRPERALVRMHHAVNGQEYRMQLQPVNGAPVPDGNGYITLNPGDEKIYSYTFTVQEIPTRILSRIDPVDVKEDKNWDNNLAEATVVPSSYDIKVEVVSDKYVYESFGGAKAFVPMKIYVTRKDIIPGDIQAELSVSGPVSSYTKTITLPPGGQYVARYEFGADPGSYTLSAEAWPDGLEDAYPPDNRDAATVTVKNVEMPKPDSGIMPGLIDGGPIYSR
ncbi:MAG: hypothetical protein K6T65_10595 [Peptococcaceae bacterium]|nr:hypothetical protein [Peptococcaceae bacterium]